jgi:hypothetical protein
MTTRLTARRRWRGAVSVVGACVCFGMAAFTHYSVAPPWKNNYTDPEIILPGAVVRISLGASSAPSNLIPGFDAILTPSLLANPSGGGSLEWFHPVDRSMTHEVAPNQYRYRYESQQTGSKLIRRGAGASGMPVSMLHTHHISLSLPNDERLGGQTLHLHVERLTEPAEVTETSFYVANPSEVGPYEQRRATADKFISIFQIVGLVCAFVALEDFLRRHPNP